MQDGSKLLSVLLKVSEKAANIARTCRQNDALFKLLVQEKSEEEKNPRFFQDFKTLADVLIQETIRHDIALEFPELAKRVQGEENNEFSNTLGESIIIHVLPSCEETTQLLAKVMDSDIDTAKLLAMEVHREINISDVPNIMEVPDNFDVDIQDLGIWIDPIDSTADYINGVEAIDETTGIYLSGLRCVTVLIGAYSKTVGLPVLGVVNQPFYTSTNSQWKGRCYWGFQGHGINKCSMGDVDVPSEIIILSRAEDTKIKARLCDNGFSIIEASGAGYKILTVAVGQAAGYILSKGTTYKWDTCAPQALLRSLGGGVVDFTEFMAKPDCNDLNLKYLPANNDFSNSGGLIAYRDPHILEIFKTILQE